MSPATDPFFASAAATGGSTSQNLRRFAVAAMASPGVVLARHGIRFPALCPNCGAGAQRKLRVTRVGMVVVTDSDGPQDTVHVIESFDVPFCDRCIAAHEATRVRRDPHLLWKRLIGGGRAGEALGAVFAGVVALFFLKDALLDWRVAPLVLAIMPGSAALFLLRANWRRNEYMSVIPPTDVSSAVEFTPDLSLEHEPAWRAFRFRNVSYASRFRSENAMLLWDPHGETARIARAKRRKSRVRTMWIIALAVTAVVLFGLWQEYGDDLLDLIDRLR